MGFRESKIARTNRYFKDIYGYKLRDCTACSGSGEYDEFHSPPCGVCNGTGKETYPSQKALDIIMMYEFGVQEGLHRAVNTINEKFTQYEMLTKKEACDVLMELLRI